MRQTYFTCEKDGPKLTTALYISQPSLYNEKAPISYFMPKKLHKWTVIADVGNGNPTKSQQVNDLTSAEIKKETQDL